MRHPSIPHKFQETITQQRLMEIMRYEPLTGEFYWLVRKQSYGGPNLPGDRVRGTIDKAGYQIIGIDGKRYRAHRLAWLYMHGVWPLGEVDHKNRNPLDNRLENLRDTPNRFHQRGNQRAHKDNQSGFKGVTRNTKRGKPWLARCVRKTLGLFDTPEEAHEAYLKEARKVFGEYASSGE